MLRITLIAAVGFACTACATTAVPLSATFDEQDAARIFDEGSNTVRGSAVLRMRSGGAQTCAALPVELVPATRYAEERMLAIYGNSQRGYNPAAFGRSPVFEPDVPAYHRYTRQQTCDGQGNFIFDDVADGGYYVISQVTWEIPGNYFVEGGWVMGYVEVHDGETERVVLSH
tara:strand:- start:4595 stop:5110 length:516 start_codon:yes stop_codon:yes gene_type:complete